MLFILLTICAFFIPLQVKAMGTAILEPCLERALSSEPIVSSQNIVIPGYPKAFNPSLVPWKEGYLLSFRYGYHMKKQKQHPSSLRYTASFVGLAYLNKEFQVVKDSVQSLNIISHSETISCTIEDARLLQCQERLYVIFNDLPSATVKGNALYIGEIVESKGRFVLKAPAKKLFYEHAIPIEKNWSPFVYQNELYVIYSDQPRVILRVDPPTGVCHLAHQENPAYGWDWGIIRGGTPALETKEGFFTFFHSSLSADKLGQNKKDKSEKNYVMGAYLFDASPPFSVRQITLQPLGLPDYYLVDNRRKVVYPGGIVIKDPLIHVVWGKNDKEIMLSTFDKEKLLKMMEPIPQDKSQLEK